MTVDLDRTVRRLEPKGQWSDPAPLSTYRYAPAYVLLGDPGAGKSTAFERERCATPGAETVTARDFQTIYGDALSPQTETLFIDGLDEARAGGGDPRSPFDEIRSRIKKLNPKRVRLSCRELDWLGENDRTNLSKVVPGGEVIVLRLEPLNADEQRRIVETKSKIPDAESFLAEAAERGVGGLLANPQTLVLLVQAVGDNGEFPKGRTETFERACMVLAREPNEEHRNAAPLPPAEEVLDAAGRMCAVSLLSGSAGLALPTAPETDGFVPISALGETASNAVHAARTRLFVAAGDRRCAPAHANLAAFLAARYLAALVDGPVPRGRILALLTGTDGFPPTPLRSLVAWLAVMASNLRRALIEGDPVAVLMYGDVREFKPDEKALLLEEIASNPSRLYEGRWPDSALAGLVSADMEPTLRGLLADSDRDDAKQKVVEIVAKALTHAPPNENLADTLLDACRDETRWSQVREFALDAWIHSLADNPARDDRLRQALEWIRDGSIKDDGGEILGTLLRELYPDAIGPADLWQYFRIPAEPLLGQFHRFWDELPDTCPEEHLPAHLAYLAASEDNTRPSPDLPRPSDLPVRFLARAVETSGERLEASRLTKWLRVGLDEWGMLRPEGFDGEEACARICEWLEAHPAAQKAVIRCALRTPELRELGNVEYHLNELLYRSKLPKDIGAWHLDEAVVAEDADLTKKHPFAFKRGLEQNPVDVDATLARARDRLSGKRGAIQRLDNLRQDRLPEWRLGHRARLQQVDAQRSQPDEGLLRAVSSEEQQLRENRASPGLLHALAQRHYEGRRIRGPSSEARLIAALGGDARLANIALAAIRLTIERDDLPSANELARLRRRKRMSWFVWPVLIGLGDRPVNEVLALGDARLRVTLACRLLQLGLAQQATWYKRCVRERPDLVAEVLVLVGRILLASGETSVSDLHQLARDEDHAEVARRATLPLLRAFPVRARTHQHELLTYLLQSALVRCNRTELRELIEHKAGLGSITKAQRLYWLAAGLALNPNRFGSLLLEAPDAYGRCQVLEKMFPSGGVHEVRGLRESLRPAAIEFLIREIGAQRNPFRYEPGVSVGEGWTNSMGVEDHIMRLGHSSAKSAAEALQRLADEPSLPRWKPHLEHALEVQRVIRRDAEHTPPTPREVIAALNNGPPASAADLRELALDRLERIASEVRSTNADLWQVFWNQDSHGKPTGSKPENPCRDALLEILSQRLPDGCDVQPEVQYAAQRRADLRIASGEWNIPVEIKKNSHRDVWSAIRNQLLPRYTNDPATQGLGIYLVLWFGPQHTAPVPEGPRPQTPDALRDRLLARLTPEERRRAAVVVMDVTAP